MGGELEVIVMEKGEGEEEGKATSCSGSPTGPEYTVGCTSAFSVRRHRTRGPSRSPERVPGKGEQAECHIGGVGKLGHLPAHIDKPHPSALYLAYEYLGQTGCHSSCPRN